MKNERYTVSDGLVYRPDGEVLIERRNIASDGNLQQLLDLSFERGYIAHQNKVFELLDAPKELPHPTRRADGQRPNQAVADEALARDLDCTIVPAACEFDPVELDRFDGGCAEDCR